MKKIIAIALSTMLLLAATVSLSGCFGDGAKLKVYENYELTAESYAFAINKDNSSLLTTANSLLSDITANGKLNEIINSFFDGTTEFTYTNPSKPSASNKDRYLIVATNAFFPPFEYYDGNKLTGSDIQIASLLAERLGKTLYVNDMEFDSTIESVKSGESDIVMAGLTVNDERKKVVNFTNEYYESAQVIMTRADDDTFKDCKSAADIERVLKGKNESYKVGTQKGTTGYMYTAGDEDFGYEGFKNITVKDYTTGALAAKDLANGRIDAVIIDKQPAIMIAKSING